ncbi:glycoside hydrolase family 9 protein [Actinoplanes sp. NPDC026623]|uniref:glycoside hydrolase family 9 protein n=1 Tax=Actinoplanes sp. NPDC026623 TaxID=3155610 RepID=UPI00340C227B
MLTVTLTAVGPAAASAADEVEQVVNGGFTAGTDPWWSTAGMPITLRDGKACVDVPGGTTNRWDASVGQNDIDLVAGETYRYSFTATGDPDGHVARAIVGLSVAPYDTYFEASPALTVAGDTYSYTFTSAVTTAQAQVALQVGGSPTAWGLCLDDVSLVGGVPPEVYVPDTGPRVRVNQVAYLPRGPKKATLVTEATDRLCWQLRNAAGATVARGYTVPRGVDASSGQNVQTIDFGGYRGRGTGYTLVADGETSRPFDIDAAAYDQLRVDALKFYYPQRSGIEIRDDLRPGYARPAGHVGVAPNLGDDSVPCQSGVCDYRLNVSGGWYDAGDHGKYVVNGGISTWELLNTYERTTKPARLGDGTLNIPESGNRVPDILDEARWELEFMLSMRVPAGQPLAGMVHHKIHDANWTGLPLLPHLDPQQRELHPVSTAATLNLAATAAQAARIYRRYDAAFAKRALVAARIAYAAALAEPARFAPESDGVGGGAYNDSKVDDDFYWAAAELYLTTGEKKYADDVLASPVHTADIFGPGAFDWASTAAAGRLDLALVPSRLPGRAAVRASVVRGAEKYLQIQAGHPYGVAYAPPNNMWDWGSNSAILNNLVVVSAAYELTGRDRYRDGVFEGMDYLLGRNALNHSYVTGYGEVSSQNQHSRWYAHELDPALPNPPKGSLSGGANSSIQDPYAQSKLTGCVGQFCYIDDIQSWSTNELAINWNSALARVASFVADQS